ncbi:hypothetical protein Tco_0014485 [Tanacetum coccineum]
MRTDECRQNNHNRGSFTCTGQTIYDDTSLMRVLSGTTIPHHEGTTNIKKKERMVPNRVKKQKKDDEDERLLLIFKQIHINLPFLEAMIHMPKGATVLKDLLSHKEKLEKAPSSVKLILEMDEDELVPIILGRPILATARAVIDVHEGKLRGTIFASLMDYQGDSRFICIRRIRRKPHSPALTEPSHTNECLLDYAMLQQPFNAV